LGRVAGEAQKAGEKEEKEKEREREREEKEKVVQHLGLANNLAE